MTQLRVLLPNLRHRYPILSMGVFGSYVRGEQREDSDLDVLVESGDGMDLTRVWALRGKRAEAARDLRFGYVYIFGAVCPARDTGAAIIMPAVNVAAMNEHLAEISRCVAPAAHALVVLDGAGWHPKSGLDIPTNITLEFLPPYSPEINPAEQFWHELRRNHFYLRIFDTVEDVIDACCDAWNSALDKTGFVRSVTGFSWLPGIKPC